MHSSTPNYIGWLGFFEKIANSDVYVVFDDVQAERGKGFIYRNRIKTAQGPKWLTIPVKNKTEMTLVKDVEINNETDWQIKHYGAIKTNYVRCRYFDQYIEDFEKIYNRIEINLCEHNIRWIQKILKLLEIKTKIIRSSELKINEIGLEKIIGIIKALNGDIYYTGWGEGSQRYIDPERFKKEKIELKIQDFKHPVYWQPWGKFMPNLSILDYLFNRGGDFFAQDCALM